MSTKEEVKASKKIQHLNRTYHSQLGVDVLRTYKMILKVTNFVLFCFITSIQTSTEEPELEFSGRTVCLGCTKALGSIPGYKNKIK